MFVAIGSGNLTTKIGTNDKLIKKYCMFTAGEDHCETDAAAAVQMRSESGADAELMRIE